jgi:hypothetical protein
MLRTTIKVSLPFLLLALSFCSSRKSVRLNDAQGVSAGGNAQVDLGSVRMKSQRERGLLYFFASDSEGIGLRQIRWRLPLNSENPGMDCELKKISQIAEGSTFQCQKDKAKSSVKISVFEQIREGRRELVKVQLQSNEAKALERWAAELLALEFRAGNWLGANRREFFYRNTRAELFSLSADSTTVLILSPVQL